MSSGVSLPTLKALFAKSSNRCAFPKCPVNIVQRNALLGQVCHIKGAKPGSARYDVHQPASERHADGNLILLCPNHHSVIDDDEQTYTVKRLQTMKAEHEARAIQMDTVEVEAAATILSDVSISSTSQSGGITAAAVNIGTLNMPNALVSTPPSERELIAVEKLWSILQKLKKNHSDITFVESILSTEELDSFIESDEWPGSTRGVLRFASMEWGMKQMKDSGAIDCDDCRLYVSDRLWAVFFTIRALYGRLGVLYQMSFEAGIYKNWRNDKGFATHATALIGVAPFEEAKGAWPFGLDAIMGHAEAAFLHEARAIRGVKT